MPEVRLIGSDGEQVGIVKTGEALRYAQERELDLVEVAPGAKPPVCRVLDYSKYKYEQAQRQKAARKHQQQIVVREIKFRPKIAQHDYDTKKGHVERFLQAKDKVKVTIMFRGREVAHPERGEMILNRLAEELDELAQVDQRPIVDGRNMTMLLAPLKGRDDAPDESPVPQGTKPSGGKNSRRTRKHGDEPDSGEQDASAAETKEAPTREPQAPPKDKGLPPAEALVLAEMAPEPEPEASEPAPAKAAAAKKPATRKAPAAKKDAAAKKAPAAKKEPAAKKAAAKKPAAKKAAAKKAAAKKPAAEPTAS